MPIHPTAIIDPSARIGADVTIGPYCIIGADVEIGAGCWLQHHVTVLGPTKMGENNRFFAYCSIGQQAQDLKYLPNSFSELEPQLSAKFVGIDETALLS